MTENVFNAEDKLRSTLLPVLVAMFFALTPGTRGAQADALEDSASPPNLSLAGDWGFQLDPGTVGRAQHWPDTEFPDHIFLPGTTDLGGFGDAGIGIAKDAVGLTCLTRVRKYEGLAWYQKDIVIPVNWQGLQSELFLERCHWQTEVWVDGKSVGSFDSLSAPHRYDLGVLAPGSHRVTICVDNTYRMDIGKLANSFSDDTQTNWNGIVGAIELRPHPTTPIDDVQVYPASDGRAVQARVSIRSAREHAAGGQLRLTVRRLNEAEVIASTTIATESKAETTTVDLAGTFEEWSPWNPVVYELHCTLDEGNSTSEFTTTFGVRQLRAEKKQFMLNGLPLFLRGTLDCGAFPLTGHPPTDCAEWRRLFAIVQDYGMNHVRFNAWCPPEAAFAAADQLGVVLQVELPVSTKIDPAAHPDVIAFMRSEAARIRQAYGNHPSFALLSLGNQLDADWPVLDGLTAELKALDSRQLVTFNSDHGRMEPGPASDFFVGLGSKVGRFRRQLAYTGADGPLPSTDYDLTAHLKDIAVPTVFHELGQWAVYPDYAQIAKYTGVLKPAALEAYRDSAVANGTIGMAYNFHRASGVFAWALWKDDIETAFRTGDLAGFQILQLHDVPGLGEVLVGLLDVFRDSKGILTPEQFRRFCSERVPLLRMSKQVWTSDETLTATAQVANQGNAPITGAMVEWRLRDRAGTTLQTGVFPPMDLGIGLSTVGDLQVPLTVFDTARQLNIEVAIQGTDAANDWNIWVFPPRAALKEVPGVTVCRTWPEALSALRNGKRVVLALDATSPAPHTLPSRFLPVTKTTSIFSQPPTMGLLCDPSHSALATFPTAFHCDMQWWELLRAPSSCFDLSEAPAALEPIIHVIDDFHFNRKLACLFEARVGPGKLLACSLDLLDPQRDGPVAASFLQGLLNYAASDTFQPRVELDEEFLVATPTEAK